MNGLRERHWSVISERGREASGIDYAEAARLTRQLAGEKISGLCVVTDEAAQRLASANAKRRDAAAATTTTAHNGSNKTLPAASKKSTSRRRKPGGNAT